MTWGMLFGQVLNWIGRIRNGAGLEAVGEALEALTSRLQGAEQAGRNSELRLVRGRRLKEVLRGRWVDRVLIVRREGLDGTALFLLYSSVPFGGWSGSPVRVEVRALCVDVSRLRPAPARPQPND